MLLINKAIDYNVDEIKYLEIYKKKYKFVLQKICELKAICLYAKRR